MVPHGSVYELHADAVNEEDKALGCMMVTVPVVEHPAASVTV